jgi:tetratricopeptide (TPR) repeat protein
MRWRTAECFAHVELSGHQYKAARNTGLVHLDDALASAAQALACSERLIALAPADPQAWRMRATTLRVQAGFLVIGGQLQVAVATQRAAFAALERAMALPGGERVRLHDFVLGCIHVSLTLQAAGLNDEAEAATEQAVAQAERSHSADPRNEWTQRQVFAAVQVAQDLYLRGGQARRGAALYERAIAPLQPPRSDGYHTGWFWNQAWAEALQVMCWVQTGELERAHASAQRLLEWLRGGQIKLREQVGAMDAELEAHIHTAVAYVEAARGRLPQAEAAAQAACERLESMLAVRDPRDVAERLIAVQDLVRLAQAPFGESATAAALRADIVMRARRLDDVLIARGVLAAGQRSESRWLALQAQ